MPLLTSPIDGSPMRQINRYGIEIDVCPTSGGIWLDRGELEKLISLLQEEAANFQPPHRTQPANRGRDWDDDDDDDYRRPHNPQYGQNYGHGKPYKKSKVSKIMDIFDF